MAIDFPNSPTNGQIYQAGGRSWVYQSGIWSLTTSDDVTILRVPTIGTNGQVLVADSTATTGVSWADQTDPIPLILALGD
jgi:hypothetical protein